MNPVSDAFEFDKARRGFAWAAAALVALCSTTAQARPEYPPIVQEVSNSPCAPPCILCHPTNSPSSAADKPQALSGRPFYDTLALNYGWIADTGPLRDALLTYARTEVDADADGVCDDVNGFNQMPDGVCDVDVNENGINDIDDLADDLNPNDDTVLCEKPAYGCGASRMEPKGNVEDYGTFLGIFAAMTLLLRNRRRRPAERRPAER